MPSLKLRCGISRYGLGWQLCLLTAIMTCSGVLAQQQSFRRRPVDVDVKLGDTAILRCEIENQAGQAQWTKDGFALGFKKEIPGFGGRYSMFGATELGVHNLKIVNVTLKDIAEYQCQVGPLSRIKAIRSNAHLNVILPPKSIEMTNHFADAILTVKEKELTVLECIVRESRPAALITWYRNDVPFRTESRQDNTEEIEVTDMDVRIRKNTTTSKIKFLPIPQEDFSKFSCEARHAALLYPLKISVTVRVQYPPGVPRIDGYNEGDPIRENQSVTLICISLGGNPPAELIWFKNDVQIDSSYAIFGSKSRNELTIRASTKDNLARFRCEATNMMSQSPKVTEVVLSVMFPPTEVKISGPNEAKIGDMLTLTCATSNSNPRADIAWFKDGSPLENFQSLSTPSIKGGWVTTSNVTFRVDENDRKETVTCQVVNPGLGDVMSQNHVVKIIQPPGHPVIFRDSLNVTVGRLNNITCSSSGGYPPAILTWYRAGKELKSEYKVDGITAKAMLLFEANSTDNEISFICEAKSKALGTSLSTSVTFSVLYPPNGIAMHIHPKKLREAEKAYLTCESAPANPPPEISIYKDLQLVSKVYNQTVTEGRKSKVTMELDVTSELDGVNFTCEVKNLVSSRRIHETIRLDVHYKPKYKGVAEKVTAMEGDSALILLQARANPDTIKYKWTRSNSTLKTIPKKLHVEGPMLNFTEVSRKDNGKYECEGSNSEGSTTITVELNVKYPPSVTVRIPSVLVGPGEDANLECLIDANPLEESMIRWRHGEIDIPQYQPDFLDNTSYLKITNVSIENEGPYLCFVNNGVGQPVTASVFLLVKHKPKIDESPEIAKTAGSNGGTAKLICRAKGAPDVTFSWSREGIPITFKSHLAKYKTETRSVDPMIWESTLEIQNIQSEDYGLYECKARNEIGIENHNIELHIPSAPDSPRQLRVVNFTHDSVTLTWLPGFDGGFEQRYRILYVKEGSDHQRFKDVDPGSTIYSVTPLAVGTEYYFNVMAYNALGESNWTTEFLHQETSNVGTNSVSTLTLDSRPHHSHTNSPFSPSVLSAFVILGTTVLLINSLLIACVVKRRTKKRSASEQGSNKSSDMEMYSPSTYHENGENLSVSCKSTTYSQGEHQDIKSDDHSTLTSSYLVDQMNHISNGYISPDGFENIKTLSLPRRAKTAEPPLDCQQDDDGYLDVFRRNVYNFGIAHKTPPMYARTTLARPPQVPPIPELYNIPPEASYYALSSVENLIHPVPPDVLNSPGKLTSFHLSNDDPCPLYSSPRLSTFTPSKDPRGHLI